MTDPVLTDFSRPALVHAAKTNLHEFLRYLGRVTHTPPLADAGLTRWHTQVPYPWFNGVLAARPVAPDDGEIIDATAAWFSARGMNSFTWWLDATLPPADWNAFLYAHNFRRVDGPPGMTADLHALDENGKTPPGFRIVSVADVAALHEWVQTFIVGYGLPPTWAPAMNRMMTDLGLDLPVRNYLGYLDDQPVTASTLFLGAGVAGIYSVATLPAARGQGLGRAVTLAPLLDARRMGYRIGTLQSSEMGYPIYRRLGFEQVCQVEHFYSPGGRASS